MSRGFLGSDASLMLDVVVCALVLVVPLLVGSVYAARNRRAWPVHRNLQLAIGFGLLVAIAAFEVDLQLVHGGWINVVNKNPASPRLTAEQIRDVRSVLRIHLIFAVATPILWGTTIALALTRFPKPLHPNRHSPLHKLLGWLSVICLLLTSGTGLWFYYAAFLAN